MKRTGLERTDRQGVAGTEWRMQIRGERLGRVGIAVAGMEMPVKARGMEGSGSVGIVEAWQARSVLVGRGLEGKVTQARCVKEARRKVMQGELRSGRHGEFGRVMVGFGKSRIGSIR